MPYKLLIGAKKNQIKTNGENGIYFFDFSLPSIITCPNAPEACKEICFSKIYENMYSIYSKNEGAAEKRNYRNLLLTFDHNLEHFHSYLDEYVKDEERKKDIKNLIVLENEGLFEDVMERYIKNKYKNLKRRNANKHKIKMFIRIHSSGDFYSDDYFDKWVKVTNKFVSEEYENIYFMAYTKEILMIEKYLRTNNLAVNEINIKLVFSEMANSKYQFHNTNSSDLETFNSLKNLNSDNLIKYTVYNSKKEFPPSALKCKLPDKGVCSECLYCYITTNTRDIATIVL